jgi:hypothetical protein
MRDAREHEIVAVDLKPPSAPCLGPTISTDATIPIGAGMRQCRSDLTIADLKGATNYLRLETRSNLTIDRRRKSVKRGDQRRHHLAARNVV